MKLNGANGPERKDASFLYSKVKSLDISDTFPTNFRGKCISLDTIIIVSG